MHITSARRQLRVVLTFVLFTMAAAVCGQQRSVVRMGKDVVVGPAQVVEDAVAIGGSVTVEGKVRGDAVSIGGTVALTPAAIVDGSAVAIGGEIVQPEGAIIRGDIVEIGGPWADFAPGIWSAVFWSVGIIGFIGFAALALLVVALLPRQVSAVGDTAFQSPGKSIGWGVLAFMAVIPLAILLAITFVGIPLILIEAGAFVAAILFGYISVATKVGSTISKSSHWKLAPIWQALLGLVILGLAGLVPLVGWLVGAAATVLGTGALIVTAIAYRRDRNVGIKAVPSGTQDGPAQADSPEHA